MRLFDRLKGLKKTSGVKMVVTTNDRFYQWNGKIYSSDIVRACIAPKVKTIGKLLATHIRTKIISDGKKEILAVAIYSPNEDDCYPCGACRQVMYEFQGEKEIEIITEEKGELNVKKMSDFLPYGFKIQGN